MTGSNPVAITLADESFSFDWDRFVRSCASGTGYHLWGWRSIFQVGLGHPCHYLMARRGGTVCGVLPLVEVRSRLFGHALSSLPYVNYGGVLAEDTQTASALADAAARIAADRSLEYVLFRHRERSLPAHPVRTHKVTMLLQLADTAEAMWNGLDRKVRNQVRKGEKSSLTVVSGGTELLDEFYAVFARNMRDLGTPVYGRPLFAAILNAFRDDARLHVVRLGQTAIAGALSYAYGSVIEVPSASSLREHRSLCANHLMYWRIMQQAIAEGRGTFDFGRSTPNDGTFHFKEQWGATPEQLHWEYQLIGTTSLPAEDRHSTKYQTMINTWKRLPLPLATWIGPHIARAVP
jgi:FemAB-related protein (PEP-CTERM system-associated)